MPIHKRTLRRLELYRVRGQQGRARVDGKERRMTIVEQILLGIGIFGILYVIFAPWLAQIDISKNTKRIAKELEEINKTLKDLKRSAEMKE